MEAISNAELLEKLEQWALDRKILPKSFDCRHYNDCNGSLEKKGLKLDHGKTCQMSYIGKEYGKTELAPGKPFRLVIAGIDPGANYDEEQKLEGFTECQRDMEACYYGKPFDKHHPHYLGVVRTAAAILGNRGTHCLEHCYGGSRCLGDGRPYGELCVLRSFAQPNLVKCVPVENESRETKSTWEMFRNCSQHLFSELEVLKPDLLVFHGKAAQDEFTKLLKSQFEHRALHDSPKDEGGAPMIYEVIGPSGEREYFVLYLKHPSHGWLNRQWDYYNVVEPSLAILRSMRAIPPL
jgi:hypothetical protein